MSNKINLTLKIWRQKDSQAQGRFEVYTAEAIDTDMSFLEMLDVVNERLIKEGKDPVAFDHDCREGICGMCAAVVQGRPHGPMSHTTLCQLHMRHFKDQETVVIEPLRAKALPVVRDLVVDRSAFDRIIAAGGFISVKTGSAPEANTVPVSKHNADSAMDAASCIGCAACVAACPNASAMLFVGAKVSHLTLLPQGTVEAKDRVRRMVSQMDAEGFGGCSNTYACEAACPKGISVSTIARMNRQYLSANLTE